MKVPAFTRFVAACAFLASAPAAYAQPATPLLLNDAITKALETSHRLAEARARQEGAEAVVQVRHVADQPSLSVSGGYTRTNHVDEFGVPQANGTVRVIYPDIPDNYFTRMSFHWPIYTAGRFDALERAAAAEARASYRMSRPRVRTCDWRSCGSTGRSPPRVNRFACWKKPSLEPMRICATSGRDSTPDSSRPTTSRASRRSARAKSCS